MQHPRIVIVGGGAAGFMAAIACAQAQGGISVVVLEKGARLLEKVKISGGGRCNVTHACFDPRVLADYYPRGGRALIGPFHRFQPRDMVRWFGDRGVELKTEADGRMFPVTDTSQTVVDCLLREARSAGVKVSTQCAVERVDLSARGGFEVYLANHEVVQADRLLLATGGCRVAAAGQLATSLGHSLSPPVPSLFAFKVDSAWVRELAGISVEDIEVAIPGTALRERGPLVFTHWGMSGPAILKLSAWGARLLSDRQYCFAIQIHWLTRMTADQIATELRTRRQAQPARFVVNCPLPSLPARLWEKLVLAAGVAPDTRWSSLSGSAQHRLAQQLVRTELPVIGKSLHRDEFVTCGGVPLDEVEFKTMESKVRPGLYFAGELLDIDGLTGGFNFQAAWTTGWIAGRAMAAMGR